MNFYVVLCIEGNEYPLTHMSYSISKKYHSFPVTPNAGIIEFEMEAPERSEDFFFEWSVTPKMLKNGYFNFHRIDTHSIGKKLTFTDAFCVGCWYSFSYLGRKTLTLKVHISARILEMNDLKHINEWPVRNDFIKQVPPAPVEKKREPVITHIWWQDKEEQKNISELEDGQEVTLHLQVSDGLPGDNISISLCDDEGRLFRGGSKEKQITATVGSDGKTAVINKFKLEYEKEESKEEN